MIAVIILAGAVYVTLLVRYLARERFHAAEDGRNNAGRVAPANARQGRPASATTPCCTDQGLADTDEPAWTALDDLQLNRLLKESSS
ncbi:hypothetical protein [Dactylosporangium darangshiense]|uniref:Uncharacterized protein n=1 Tax=Dactylosporangium darangshiense TaxID=579108 RepID=A0ABP8DP00_9ACTN